MLLENRNPQGNRLDIKLQGRGQNRDAVGARVEVTAGGRTQVAVVQAGKSYGNSEPMQLHFGLGRAAEASLIRIFWPDGSMNRLEKVAANQIPGVVQP